MSNNPIKILNGTNGQLALYSDKIIITRKGFMATKEKTIYLNQITGVQLKQPSRWTKGYILFTVPGSVETRGDPIMAVMDENAVMFDSANNDAALEIKNTTEKLMSQYARIATNFSPADELKKFKQLLDDGTISKEEFEQKKKQLLG
jgi:hypothetical protein